MGDADERDVYTGLSRIAISHEAATPAGLEVDAKVKLAEVNGRKLMFEVEGYDRVERIAKGRHERYMIN